MKVRLSQSEQIIDIGSTNVPDVITENYEFIATSPILGIVTHHDDLGSIYRLEVLQKTDGCNVNS